MEDYLEAIYILEQDSGYVRIKDIAGKMSVTMPSASAAVKKIEKLGLVNHPKYNLVALTPAGALAAEKIYNRHRVICSFLTDILGLDEELAEKQACSLEHVISRETLEGLSRLIENKEVFQIHFNSKI